MCCMEDIKAMIIIGIIAYLILGGKSGEKKDDKKGGGKK